MKANLTMLQGQQVVCAVSGGADSVALLHLLRSVSAQMELRLTAAHYHHGLREAAQDDEAFVRELCSRWEIPLVVGRGNAAQMAAQWGMSVEEAARKLRYEFLLQQPGLIAVAHHADDQVETVLLNFLRGTGLKGLGGMELQHGRIVRPLLGVTREEIEAYIVCHGLPYRTDETNEEDDALRNRLRHHVIPLLKEENPNLSQTVERMTALLQHDEMILQQQTEELLEQAKRNGGYDCCVLRKSELCRRAVRKLLDQIPKPTMAHVEAVCSLMADTRGTKQVQLPGVTVTREYDILHFGKSISGEIPLPVTADPSCGGSLDWGDWRIVWEKDACGGKPFTIRSRQTGDVVRLPGGTKTVKKFLIDRKIPAEKRDRLPLVVCCGEIVAAADLFMGTTGIKIEERKR